MKASAADSAIDIAYWYLDRADEEKLFLDEEKLQPLRWRLLQSLWNLSK